MPLLRLVPFQTEQSRYTFDYSRKSPRLPADVLVCRKGKTKSEIEENTLRQSFKECLPAFKSGLKHSGVSGGKGDFTRSVC